MKTRTPFDRHDLKIKKNDLVLEVGSGHNPSYRSNIIVDKYIDDNSNRCGNIKIFKHQQFINADGENLPFSDKQFDYVICNQVLEHTENPQKFVNELARVAKRGYIETPSLIGELLFPKESHKWVILEIDNKLVFYNKKICQEIILIIMATYFLITYLISHWLINCYGLQRVALCLIG